jgi:hypothetical protein
MCGYSYKSGPSIPLKRGEKAAMLIIGLVLTTGAVWRWML